MQTTNNTTTENKKVYELVKTLPIIRCYYQGRSHSHPVKRTMAVIKEDDDRVTGYEFRCGNTVRDVEEAKGTIRTYKKNKIAKYGDYIRLRANHQNLMKGADESTLTRESIMTFLTKGA